MTSFNSFLIEYFNEVPTVSTPTIPAQTVAAGDTLLIDLALYLTDPENAPLAILFDAGTPTYISYQAPSSIKINPPNLASPQTITVGFSASDGYNAAEIFSFDLTIINDPP